MKAWKTYNKFDIYSTVVFAETRGQAKALALHTDCHDGCEFTDISVYRAPELDSEYRGHYEMDFFANDQDRLALVKFGGYHCEYPEDEKCAVCVARDFCEGYKEEIKKALPELIEKFNT